MRNAPWKLGTLLALAASIGCAKATFTVTATGTHVTVLPTNPVHLQDHETQSFTVTPDANYQLLSKVDGTCPAGSWKGNVYTTGAITANCSVSFGAAIETFSVTVAGIHASADPSDVQTVAAGATQGYTVTADTGYTTSQVVGGTCPDGSWSENTYTTGPINANCVVVFNTTQNTYQVTVSGDTWETIDPNTAQTVAYGAKQSFSAIPQTGYSNSATVGGTCPAGTWANDLYTTGPITADCTVLFSAMLDTFQVTSVGDGRESIAPGDPQIVGYGATQTFTVTANAGYRLAQTVSGDCPAGSWNGNAYTTGTITANCSVRFGAILVHQVSASGDGWETINPSAPRTVVDGATPSFAVTANSGYVLSTVGGTCPGGSWTGSIYTTGPVTTDCSVTFSAVPASQLMVSGDANVTASPTGSIWVATGTAQAFTVTPGTGEAASFAVGGNCPFGVWSGQVYTTGLITTDCTLGFTGISPVLQPLTWTASADDATAVTTVTNVTGATDTVQFTYADAAGGQGSPKTYTAQTTATASQSIQLAWDYAGSHAFFMATARLDAFADGPGGRTTIALQPQQAVSGNFHFSGTTTLPVRAGSAFGIIATGGNDDSNRNLSGTITLSTVSEGPDAAVSASGDSWETISPAAQVVSDGTVASFTVTANPGYTLSSTVGGTCPAGTWNGNVYTTGTIQGDCTVSFAAGYQVTSEGVDVNIAPGGVEWVTPGAQPTFTVSAQSGDTLNPIVGGTCPAGTWNAGVYTTGAVTGDCTVRFSVQAVFMYSGGIYNGTSLGDQAHSAGLCQAQASHYPALPCAQAVALLGYAPNGVSDLPAKYSVPTGEPIIGSNGTQIASSWSDLLNLSSGVDALLDSGGVLDPSGPNTSTAWTGFTTGGGAILNCSDWTNGSSPAAETGDNWSSYYDQCSVSYYSLLCLCWGG